MQLTEELLRKGFAVCDVTGADLPAWQESKKVCFREYVDRWYGGWDDEAQLRMNEATFEKSRKLSCLKKVLLHGETVGFLGFDEGPEEITGLLIHVSAPARNQGLGAWFLSQVRALGKPASLKVFKDNPARRLYERHGFAVCGETDSHYLMKSLPLTLAEK